jgi:hypothetical protein
MDKQDNDYKRAEKISFGGLIFGLALAAVWYLVGQLTGGSGGFLSTIAQPMMIASVVFAGLFPPLWLYFSYVRPQNS